MSGPKRLAWHQLSGQDRIHERWAVVMAARLRDPTAKNWTQDENQAADEEDEAIEMCDALRGMGSRAMNMIEDPDDLRADVAAPFSKGSDR